MTDAPANAPADPPAVQHAAPHDAHAPSAAPAASAPHAPHSKAKYFYVFGVLTVLTAVEVGVAKILRGERGVMIALLVALAVTKAGFVAWYYMHMNGEKRGLKLAVGIPMLFPPLAAVVLMLEALARFHHGP